MICRWMACLLAGTALAGVAHVGGAFAADPEPIRITVISDLNDDLYDARSGRGGVDATRMAVADFGGSVLGRPIVVDALNDHNKAAEAPALARQAYDAGADLLMDVQNSPIATEISKVATERRKLAISTIAASPALTRAACSKYFYHYSFDLPAIATATANYLTAQPQNKRWATIAEDTGFGKAGAGLMSPIVAAHGGEIVKSIVIPQQNTEADFSNALGDISGANPDVVAVFDDAAKGDAGIAFLNKAKLKATITTALLYLSDVDRVKDGYAGVVATVPWYWNLDPAARAWADRFAAAHNGLRPDAGQAADYSATLQWLNAVKTAGTTDADAVIRALDGHKFDDMFAHNAEFRASDHMVVHDLYVAKVKSSAQLSESHGWFEIVSTIPAATAFPDGTECKMPQ
jgi:branched-chain amino acid transport system substrate-binding protein